MADTTPEEERMDRKTARATLERIADARDHCAEHGTYPVAPYGPGQDQGFDDWAADMADAALAQLATHDRRIRTAIEEWAADDVAMGANPYRARSLLATIWSQLGGEGRLFTHVGQKMASEPVS